MSEIRIKKPIKKFPTLGCCGLDCGLCPRYYTVGSSRCPGCCGPNFFNKHPGCPFITCCVKKKNLEVCSQCDEFPCSKFNGWDAGDSFISHKISISNLILIRKSGLGKFIKQQAQRIKLLEIMQKNYDEGRSKSFYCISTALLPITDIETLLNTAEQEIEDNKINEDDKKARAKILKKLINDFAGKQGIELKLRKG
ncbi:MAG: DUF3795 domain-containing protein [Bacteroidales bacterium]|nr:DUF3795 domain-containing protein [Bacteroidales bacterium]